MKKGRISSYNQLANWLFVLIIQTLNKEVWKIHKLKDLRDEKNRGIKLCGYLDGDAGDFEIYLNADKNTNSDRNEIAKTLLHEVLHIIFYRVKESRILGLERYLWHELSRAQKKILKSYIPKHYSKI